MKILTQIPKRRITRPNQRQLLLPEPTFDLLLPRNRVPHVSKRLKPHQSIHVISFRKATNQFPFVLHHAPLQIVCHTDVKHPSRRAQNISMVNSHMSPGSGFFRHPGPHLCHPERSEGSWLDRAIPKIDVTIAISPRKPHSLTPRCITSTASVQHTRNRSPTPARRVRAPVA